MHCRTSVFTSRAKREITESPSPNPEAFYMGGRAAKLRFLEAEARRLRLLLRQCWIIFWVPGVCQLTKQEVWRHADVRIQEIPRAFFTLSSLYRFHVFSCHVQGLSVLRAAMHGKICNKHQRVQRKMKFRDHLPCLELTCCRLFGHQFRFLCFAELQMNQVHPSTESLPYSESWHVALIIECLSWLVPTNRIK